MEQLIKRRTKTCANRSIQYMLKGIDLTLNCTANALVDMKKRQGHILDLRICGQ